MTDAPRVLHLVNGTGPTTVPARLADRQREGAAEVTTASWYGARRPAAGDGTEGLGAARWCDVGAWRRLRGLLADRCPDVLHLHHTASAAAGALAAGGRGGPVVVKTEHGDRARKGPGQSALDLLTMARADAVVANSDATLRSFRPWERWVTRGRRTRIHNGVDLAAIGSARDRAPPGDGAPDGEPVVLCVARLVDGKNHARLLDATRRLVEDRGTPVRLTLVGDGPIRSSLEARASELGLADRVTFTGEIDRAEVYARLWAADLFVLPSLSEGFCNAAAEAMAAGLPVVASDVPALREVVGEAGRYCDPRSPRDIADAMADVLSRPAEERRRTGTALRERAEARFSLDRSAGTYLALYRELLEGRPGGGR